MKSHCRFFRAGVGTVIFNDNREVLFFERCKHPVGVWQFQQGGIDLGEDIKTTLWRELQEEAGFTEADFTSLVEMPHWTVYQDPNSVADQDIGRLGQAHRWFFLKLNPNVLVDLTKASDNEFINFKWVSFAEAIAATDGLKKHVYEELYEFFNQIIPVT